LIISFRITVGISRRRIWCSARSSGAT